MKNEEEQIKTLADLWKEIVKIRPDFIEILKDPEFGGSEVDLILSGLKHSKVAFHNDELQFVRSLISRIITEIDLLLPQMTASKKKEIVALLESATIFIVLLVFIMRCNERKKNASNEINRNIRNIL